MGILWRYVAAMYLKAFAGSLVALCAIYLVVDYVDRAKAYTGEGWLAAVLELYGYKAIVVAYQLAPAALLLGAGIALAGLRQSNEYMAIRALAISPASAWGTIAVLALLLAAGAALTDELFVARASRRIDEISAGRFRSWGDWRQYFGENHWFRGKRQIYQLRAGTPEDGFGDVTIYQLSEDFRLARRVDARAMVPVEGRTWRLLDGSERVLARQGSPVEHFERRDFELDEDPSAFQIAKGRPQQLELGELREQIRLRRQVGLPADRYLLALYEKFSYPLGGLPGALLGCALVLRPGRRSYLTSALAEGFFAIVAFWALLVVFKAAALSGAASAAVAAWAPGVLFGGLAAVALWRWAR